MGDFSGSRKSMASENPHRTTRPWAPVTGMAQTRKAEAIAKLCRQWNSWDWSNPCTTHGSLEWQRWDPRNTEDFSKQRFAHTCQSGNLLVHPCEPRLSYELADLGRTMTRRALEKKKHQFPLFRFHPVWYIVNTMSHHGARRTAGLSHSSSSGVFVGQARE